MATWSRSKSPASACCAIRSGMRSRPQRRERLENRETNNKSKEILMNRPKHLLPTTVVGSYPQPEWLVDRAMLSKVVPRTRLHAMWRLPAEHLEEAQDDATIVAIR